MPFKGSDCHQSATMMFESIEVVMTAHLPKERDNGLPALAFNRESSPYSAPFHEDVLFGVTEHTKPIFLRLETDIVAWLDTQGLANLDGNGDLALAGDFGAEEWRRCGLSGSGHGQGLLTFSKILLTFPLEQGARSEEHTSELQ